ncbi:endonuclease MutS2 [Ornithinibacillus sp. 4-3]|uniref:Endonuclease MutS2 n=1 Tax=Ornithinibacillus sp. 4-3 TaxID=3231488 RepID=A0AB39HLV2_9BACI
MNDRMLRVLEYNKIIEQLKTHTETSFGKSLVEELKPAITLTEVQQLQMETDEAMQLLRLNKVIPLGGIRDIRAHVKRSVIGGILNPSECLDVANTIYGGRNVKRFLEEEKEEELEEKLPILQQLAEQITPLRSLEQQIKMCIDDNSEVLDGASDALRHIRSSIRTFENRIRERMDQFIRTKSSLLSDAIITIRNGRYVLPVKQESRGAFGGVVHDQSASGQTLFMEPKAIVDLNNQLQTEKAKEKQEVQKILSKLTEVIAEHNEELYQNVERLAEIDFIFARAKLGYTMRGSMPKLNEDGIIKLKQARHPLLPTDEVVANDVEIGESFTSILITGPNTGGKTVVLKMVGLITLMAQSGLQVPALDGCEVAVFTNVFADIGDEQSIEQSLSTFSSHMTNIVRILEQVDYQTLVLFDELGAGTDPGEGAALAMAILDEVISRGARVIATTHYPELKAYGYNRENVVNASVEFDVETLKPTYRLLIGVPGRSNAFEISKRLGLEERIINQARDLVGIDSKNVENMIASLEKSQIQAANEYEEAHQVLLESEKLRAELEAEWEKLNATREKLYKRAEEKAEKAVQHALEEATAIVEKIKAMEADVTFKEHEWIDARKSLEDAKLKLSGANQEDPEESSEAANNELEPGDDVQLLTLNQSGTVIEQVNKEEYFVSVGALRLKVPRKNLKRLKKKKTVEQKPVSVVRGLSAHVRPELDLRGERYEDALLQLEKYIDDAILANYAKVSIIHGKGTGALRKGVQQFAKKHSRITSYRDGSAEEGGSGVTVIEF